MNEVTYHRNPEADFRISYNWFQKCDWLDMNVAHVDDSDLVQNKLPECWSWYQFCLWANDFCNWVFIESVSRATPFPSTRQDKRSLVGCFWTIRGETFVVVVKFTLINLHTGQHFLWNQEHNGKIRSNWIFDLSVIEFWTMPGNCAAVMLQPPEKLVISGIYGERVEIKWKQWTDLDTIRMRKQSNIRPKVSPRCHSEMYLSFRTD